MKNLLLLMGLMLGGLSLKAQFPAGGAGKGVPNMGHVYGKLVDSAGRPIAAAFWIAVHGRQK